MGAETGIGWTDATFNPWWGCAHVSPGCVNCYAETFDRRTGGDHWHKGGARRTFGEKHWAEPRAWNDKAAREGVRRRVFCASMADVFEDHPTANAERPKLWDLIAETPMLDWLILTKRPENMPGMLPESWGEGWANVWLGTSCEDQQRADERIPRLVATPAALRFLSVEPLIGPVDLVALAQPRRPPWERRLADTGLHDPKDIRWVIVGGESGPGHRAMELDWLFKVADETLGAMVPLFVKQDSGPRPGQQGRIPDWLWQFKEVPASPAPVSGPAGQAVLL